MAHGPVVVVSRALSWLLFAAILFTIACKDTSAPTPVAAKLVFLTAQPSTTIANLPIAPAVKVAVQDADGNVITSATNSITISLGTNPSQANLLGNTTIAAIDGVATFPDLRVDKPGPGFTLVASAQNLTSAGTTAFAVVVGAAAKLVFTTQPVSTLARTPMPPVAVSVQDAAGNVVPISILIGIRIGFNVGSGELTGATTRTTVEGVASFAGLTISNPGTGYTLQAFAVNNPTGIQVTNSAPFNQTVGPAVRVGFTAQPSLTRPGEVIPTVIAAALDSAGNIIRTVTPTMTVAIGANTGNGTLAGTTAIAAVNGVAAFADLKINNPGGYTLVVSSPGFGGDTSRIFDVRITLTFASVSAGYFHSCGVTTTGDAYCWGSNAVGQLGNGGTSPASAPERVAGGLKFTSVTAGRDHSCGVAVSGVGYCWGASDDGALGSPGAMSRVPAAVSGGLTFGSVIGGYSHTCGLTPAGATYCWGDNSTGALGNGTFTSAGTPAVISGLSLSNVSPGRYFTCGVTVARVPYCWGDNADGYLGDGTANRRNSPGVVSGQLEFAAVGAGGFHACGLTVAGGAYCWGANGAGQLGDGTNLRRMTPVPVMGGLTFTALSVGNRHSCALTSGGAAYCWGDNSNGNLGNGGMPNSLVPIVVSGGLTFSSVSAGRFHSCGVTPSGLAYCWGENSANQLGDGTQVNRLAPVPVR